MGKFTGLVLAGRRGPADPLAEAQGTSHRALLEVGGTPMLVRVVRALRATASVERIAVSIDEPAVLDDVPELAALIAEGSLVPHTSRSSPSRSVLAVLETLAGDEKLLVTTADHPLLTRDMIDHFVASDADADVLVGVVAASLLRARYPESTRTYLRLRDDAYSGANLFAFRTASAQRAAAFWVRAEQFRKQPWRLASVFGPTALLLFVLRRLDLEAAFERVSRAMGVRVRPVRLPFPEAAIDVDRPTDLVLASRILEERASAHPDPDCP
jgi:GTP:adenosylcobinamide-phosphate guanylyltransferase